MRTDQDYQVGTVIAVPKGGWVMKKDAQGLKIDFHTMADSDAAKNSIILDEGTELLIVDIEGPHPRRTLEETSKATMQRLRQDGSYNPDSVKIEGALSGDWLTHSIEGSRAPIIRQMKIQFV